MSKTEKEMREEFERELREVHNVQDLIKSIKPNGVELHEEAYDKCVNIVLRQKQVGGDHYNKHSIQPWDIIDSWGVEFLRGKYHKVPFTPQK